MKSKKEKYKRDYRLQVWGKKVKKNKKYCSLCGKKTRRLDAHHIFSKSNFPTLKYFVWNGIAVCEDCHAGIHKNNYRATTTPVDLLSYMLRTGKAKPITTVLDICILLLSIFMMLDTIYYLAIS